VGPSAVTVAYALNGWGTAGLIATTRRTQGNSLSGLLERALLLYPQASLFLSRILLLLRSFSCPPSPCPRTWHNRRAPPDSLLSGMCLVCSLVAWSCSLWFSGSLGLATNRWFSAASALSSSAGSQPIALACFWLYHRALARASALLAPSILLLPSVTTLVRSVALTSPALLSVPGSVVAFALTTASSPCIFFAFLGLWLACVLSRLLWLYSTGLGLWNYGARVSLADEWWCTAAQVAVQYSGSG
jgi:hypothetical protein